MAKKEGKKKTPTEPSTGGGRIRQMRTVFRITRQRDSRLVLWMLIGFLGPFALALLALTFLGIWLPISIAIAVLIGALSCMIVFGRRAQRGMLRELEGQPGAAMWVLQNLRGNWRTTPAVAGNTQLDTVHRVIGRAGIVLVGEGAPHRLRGLLGQEKKRLARVAGDTPIYDIIVGNDEDEVTLGRLNKYFLKLPRNLTASQINALDTRLQALGGSKAGLPKGPIPKNARLPGIERTIRRR